LLNYRIYWSCRNLLNIIYYDQFCVYFNEQGTNIKKSKEIPIQKIDKNVHHIFRFGTWNASLADLYRHTLFLSTGKRNIAPAKMYQKEMERITGLTKFDIGIDFGGYSPFWAALFAF